MKSPANRHRGRSGGIRAGLAVACLLAVYTLTAGWPSAASPAFGPAFQAGVTHGEHSLDSWGYARAVQRGKSLLRTVGPLQNQHIMGWGAGNPEPRRGRFNWGSLDDRVGLIRETGGTPVVTLCCAPDWMKGGRPGQTNWRRLEAAPRREHFDEFAALAVKVAQRYRDVRYFQVWNELKGFWNDRQNRWDYEAYTDLYNTVYDALKRFDPRLQVGGPYVPMDSWSRPAAAGGHASSLRGRWGTVDRRSLDAVRYWLSHMHGADFLTVDGHTASNDGPVPRAAVGARKFGAVTRWLRRRTSLPIWWSEFYVEPAAGPGRNGGTRRVRMALKAMRASGASTALLWQPECRGGALPCLWTSTTRRRNGGRATNLLPVFRRFRGRQLRSRDPAR